jgi:hypothetical protein
LYAISARRTTGPVLFPHKTNSERYVTLILSPFFDQPTDAEISYQHFFQDNAMAHAASNSVDVLADFFGDRGKCRGLWPLRSPDLNPRDFRLCDMLKEKV